VQDVEAGLSLPADQKSPSLSYSHVSRALQREAAVRIDAAVRGETGVNRSAETDREAAKRLDLNSK